ncbi:protein DpdE [Vibrio alfacsensis]|uniref:protein DpdE n=1 Tax=Vibrio alfacsensis TaxID=1074311 RepID=UPI00406890F7
MNIEIGQLVRSENGLGIGKVVEVDSKLVKVSYFDSPMRMSVLEKVLSIEEVKEENLLIETIVYYYDYEAQEWSVGRIVGPTPPPADYRVQFPNDVYRDLSQVDIYVRWNKPLSSPIEWLAHQETYTPIFQEARVDFQNHMLDQREACAGVTAALSSSIELESHQLAVVRRVLSDPIQRYLLADEVGLGKTIEAGLILRQHVLDHPDSHKVLVLVPEALHQQWVRELSQRFHLSELLDKSVIVQTYNQYLADKTTFDANLVLIDEAHQIAEWGWSTSRQQQQAYQRIANLVHMSNKLLLLSATPLVGNERNFLAMLHLLDAENYHLTEQGVTEFSKRVELREQIGGLIQSFSTSNINLKLLQHLKSLKRILESDNVFLALAEELEPSLLESRFSSDRSENADKLIRQIRNHIANRHGVHHRMLRNRRSSEGISQLLPGLAEQGLERMTFSSAGLNEALEAWHQHMLINDPHSKRFAAIYMMFVEASLGSPQVLVQMANSRLSKLELSQQDFLLSDQQREQLCSALVPDESELLEQIVEQGEDAQEQYLKVLVKQLDSLMSDTKAGVVIFCDHPWSADQLSADICFNYSRSQVQRHNPNQPLRFGKDPECRVLICDRRAEEGINLHGGHRVAIHYDIPLSPNRMEQRNGRMNRYAADQFAAPVRSMVIESNDAQSFTTLWINVLDNSFEMFKQSIAGLQFVIEEQMNLVTEALFIEGIEALHNLDERLVGSGQILESEWTRIRNLEALMAIDTDVQEAQQFAYKLQDVDEREDEFQKVARAWISKTLGFGSFEDRYVYLPPQQSGRATMVNVHMLREHCLLGFESENEDFPMPTTFPMDYIRSDAQDAHKRVARLGEPFHDAMLSILPYEARGRASAMKREVAKMEKDREGVVFCLEYVATTEFDSSDEYATTLVRISDQLMPPKRFTLWLNSQGEPIENPDAVNFFARKYCKKSNGGSDTNLAKKWPEIDYMYSKDAWYELCFSIEESALVSVETKYQDIHRSGLDNLENYLVSDPSLPESFVAQLRQAFGQPVYKCLAAKAVFLVSGQSSLN